LHDFTAVLYCFFKFVKSEAMRSRALEALLELSTRLERNPGYFEKHHEIKSNVHFFNEIIAVFNKKNIII